MFEEFLNGIRDKYTSEKYNMISNNCNNFSDECL